MASREKPTTHREALRLACVAPTWRGDGGFAAVWVQPWVAVGKRLPRQGHSSKPLPYCTPLETMTGDCWGLHSHSDQNRVEPLS